MRATLFSVEGTGIVLLTLVLGGCGGSNANLAPVTGQIVYKNAPLEGAQVTFIAPKSARPATGATDKDGRFNLSTFDFKDGATIGENVVIVTKFAVEENKTAGDNSVSGALLSPNLVDDNTDLEAKRKSMNSSIEMQMKMTVQKKASSDSGPKSLIPAKYGSAKTSPLKAEVKPGSNKFVFELVD